MEEIPDFSVDEDDEASEANSLSLPNSNWINCTHCIKLHRCQRVIPYGNNTSFEIQRLFSKVDADGEDAEDGEGAKAKK
jgi:succinate dehydrogenase/fumarate reductase-like Fe-S protein